MKDMSGNKKVRFLICLAICVFGCNFAFGQTPNLKAKRLTIKAKEQPLGVVFRYLMEKYELTIGFEQSILDRNHSEYSFLTNLPAVATHRQSIDNGRIKLATTSEPTFTAQSKPITLDFENTKLKVVFDQIVQQMKNYSWEINDGVINIFPKQGRDNRFKELLDMKVERFVLEKGRTVQDITTTLVLLPEFQSYLKKNNFHIFDVRDGFDYVIAAQYGRKLDREISGSKLTIRELLNTAAKVKKGGWILRWRYVMKSSGKELIDIDI